MREKSRSIRRHQRPELELLCDACSWGRRRYRIVGESQDLPSRAKRDGKFNLKRYRLAAISAIFVVAVVIAAYRLYYNSWLGKPLLSHAKTLSAALDNRDTRTVFSYISPDEVRLLQLDRRKFEALLNLYGESKPKDITWKPWEYQASDRDSMVISDMIGVRKNSVLMYGYTFSLHRTESGLASMLVTQLVYGMCRNRFLSEKDEVPAKNRDALAIYRGIVFYKPQLEQVGLKGVLDENSLEKVITWDELRHFWKHRLEESGVPAPLLQ